jgi:metal-responsive CopG/Arc/MetJ family transcriptional regulator
MVDMNSTPEVLAVSLPADLIEELTTLANEQGRSISEVVREACLAYVEPFFWEQVYNERSRQRFSSGPDDFVK